MESGSGKILIEIREAAFPNDLDKEMLLQLIGRHRPELKAPPRRKLKKKHRFLSDSTGSLASDKEDFQGSEKCDAIKVVQQSSYLIAAGRRSNSESDVTRSSGRSSLEASDGFVNVVTDLDNDSVGCAPEFPDNGLKGKEASNSKPAFEHEILEVHTSKYNNILAGGVVKFGKSVGAAEEPEFTKDQEQLISDKGQLALSDTIQHTEKQESHKIPGHETHKSKYRNILAGGLVKFGKSKSAVEGFEVTKSQEQLIIEGSYKVLAAPSDITSAKENTEVDKQEIQQTPEHETQESLYKNILAGSLVRFGKFMNVVDEPEATSDHMQSAEKNPNDESEVKSQETPLITDDDKQENNESRYRNILAGSIVKMAKSFKIESNDMQVEVEDDTSVVLMEDLVAASAVSHLEEWHSEVNTCEKVVVDEADVGIVALGAIVSNDKAYINEFTEDTVETVEHVEVRFDVADDYSDVAEVPAEYSDVQLVEEDIVPIDESCSVHSDEGGSARDGVPRICGEIEFKLDYDYKHNHLLVTINQCRDLDLMNTKKQRTDPYVKTYLLPDMSKSSKRKTKTKQNTRNPVFKEVLKYKMRRTELEIRSLLLIVMHRDVLGHNQLIGEAEPLPLNSQFGNSFSRWCPIFRKEPISLSVFSYFGEIELSLTFVTYEIDLSAQATTEQDSHKLVVAEGGASSLVSTEIKPATPEHDLNAGASTGLYRAKPTFSGTTPKLYQAKGEPVDAKTMKELTTSTLEKNECQEYQPILNPSGELRILVKGANNLTSLITSRNAPETFCTGHMQPSRGEKEAKNTTSTRKDFNPRWNYTFIFDDVSASELEKSYVEICVWQYDKKNNYLIGATRIGFLSECFRKGIRGVDRLTEEEIVWRNVLDEHNTKFDTSLVLRRINT